MANGKSSTKEIIVEAAILLFNIKGFDGTSIRDIAKKARVNPANISYYFESKQGLLEKCFIQFFEGYLQFIEEEVNLIAYDRPDDCMKRAVYKLLTFQSKNHHLSRFVWREVSIDSQIVREITVSYFMKERYLFKKLIEAIQPDHSNSHVNMSYIIIQLRSLLTMPFLNSQYLREVWNIFPQENYFVEKYYEKINEWIDTNIINNHRKINIPI